MRNPLRGLEVPGSATPNIATVSTESEARILAAAHTPRAEKFYAHLSDARLRAELEAAFISSPYPGVQHEASQGRSLDRAELAAQLRELAQTLES